MQTFLEVVEGDQAGGELAVEIIVRLIDGAQARESVVVGVHAEAERLVLPHRRGPPVVAVMAEAVHLLRQTFLLHLRLLVAFLLLLPLTFFLELLAGVASDFLFE